MVPATRSANRIQGFDPREFLATIGEGRKVLAFSKKQTIFSQGDAADTVFYIQEGKVRLTVVSKIGKEATLGILSEENFFGEGCLVGKLVRMKSATAMTDCKLLRVDKKAMMQALHREHAFSDLFVAYLLARNIRYEEDLVDQLFNSSEKRLAPAFACSLRQGGSARDCDRQDEPGNLGGYDRYHSVAGKLFHEPIQKIGLHRL